MHSLLRNRLRRRPPSRSIFVRVVDARGRATRAGAEVRVFAAGTRRLLGDAPGRFGIRLQRAERPARAHRTADRRGRVDVEVTFPAAGPQATPCAWRSTGARHLAGDQDDPWTLTMIVRSMSLLVMPLPDARAFEPARARMTPHVYHTPLLTSRTLSERTGFDVRLKAELFQRTGSYKIRGPLNKFTFLTDEEKARGVICSSAGNHAQGVALAARIHGIHAVVCMAANATPSKVEATRAYGAEVVLHGSIWDEANEKAQELVRERGYTYIHPFDDLQLIGGQGTVGLEIFEDWPEVDVVVVPDRRGRADFGRGAGAQEPQPDGPDHRGRVVGRARR